MMGRPTSEATLRVRGSRWPVDRKGGTPSLPCPRVRTGPLTLGAAGTLNSNGDYVGWVGKADVDGVYIWAKSLANGYVGGMATDSKGNV